MNTLRIDTYFSQLAVLLSAGLVVLLISGCAGTLSKTMTTPAKLGFVTGTHRDLVSLPKPAGKIPVAVYSFRDQTGQYKPLPNVTSFSTAVTQGATSMLVQALLDSGWFVPVEREGLQDLLTERKITRATLNNNAENQDDQQSQFPSLVNAQMIIEGGIIAYETNLTTGGFGAKYYGAGGNLEYRVDRVTLYLRAIDVRTGVVLKSVSTNKTILSRVVDIGIFRYVTFQRLLEVETGLSTNEPPQMCVLEALEKAVTALVIEGIEEGLWNLENPDDINSPVILNYQKEKGEMEVQLDRNGELVDEKL
jgi:curli production assembly/transport component CsgG